LPRRVLFTGNDFTRLNQDVKGNNFLFLSDLSQFPAQLPVNFYKKTRRQNPKNKNQQRPIACLDRES